MKKTKTFNVGDKVFAKVKGYPAWPAKIVAANGRKYEVNFYGTGETGSIKVEDLFYYLKHKEQFCRNLKRKDYIEAVEQIEEEIKVTGTDGNEGNDDNTTAPEETEKVKGRKRKRSEDVRKSITPNDTPQPEENNIPVADTTTEESNDVKPTSQVSRSGRLIKTKRYSSEEPEELEKRPSKRRKSSPEPTADPPKVIEKPMETEDVPETVEKLEESKEDDGPEKKETETKEKLEEEDTNKSVKDLKEEKVEVKEEKVEEKEEKVEEKEEKVEEKEEAEEDDRDQELVDVNVISTEYLNAVIAYAEHVKSNARIYKAKNEEPRDNLPNEVVLARLPTGKTVGIKYGMNHQKNSFRIRESPFGRRRSHDDTLAQGSRREGRLQTAGRPEHVRRQPQASRGGIGNAPERREDARTDPNKIKFDKNRGELGRLRRQDQGMPRIG